MDIQIMLKKTFIIRGCLTCSYTQNVIQHSYKYVAYKAINIILNERSCPSLENKSLENNVLAPACINALKHNLD